MSAPGPSKIPVLEAHQRKNTDGSLGYEVKILPPSIATDRFIKHCQQIKKRQISQALKAGRMAEYVELFKKNPAEVVVKSDENADSTSMHLRYMTSAAAHSEASQAARAAEDFDVIIRNLIGDDLHMNTDSVAVLELIIHDSHPQYINMMVMRDRINDLLCVIAWQLRDLQTTLPWSSSEEIHELNNFYKWSVKLFQAVYKKKDSPLVPHLTTRTLRVVTMQFLTILADPNVDALQDADSIRSHAHQVVIRIIEQSDPNALICAIIQVFHETMRMKNDRLLEMATKCLWWLLKQFPEWKPRKFYDFDLHSIMRAFQAFIKFNSIDDPTMRESTAVKTFKTLLFTFVMHVGGENVLKELEVIPDLKDTEIQAYVIKLLQHEGSTEISPTIFDDSNLDLYVSCMEELPELSPAI